MSKVTMKVLLYITKGPLEMWLKITRCENTSGYPSEFIVTTGGLALGMQENQSQRGTGWSKVEPGTKECRPALKASKGKEMDSLGESISRGVQPVAHGPHVAQDGYECGPTQNRKFA